MHSISSRNFFLVLGLVFVTGLGLLVWAAGHHDREGLDARDITIERIAKVAPSLPASQLIEVKKTLGFLTTDRPETITARFFRDLGISLILSVLLTWVIELYARNRLQDEIRTGVLEAAYKRIIPPVIFDEVRASVLKSQLLKENWLLNMTVERLPDTDGDQSPVYVSKTVQTYRLTNETKGRATHLVEVELDEDVLRQIGDGNCPRFDRVTIGNKVFEGEELKKYAPSPGTCFKMDVEVNAQPVDIKIEATELIPVPDVWVWSTRLCTNGASIRILAPDDLEFKVSALHPERTRLVSYPSGFWEFKGGMLPWQGFELRVKRKSSKSLPQAV
jgi:hypothetical protein